MPRLKRAEKASLSLLQWEDTIQRYHQLGARNWVLTGLCVCLSLGLPSFQNSEIQISVVQKSPGLGYFLPAAWTDGGTHLLCFGCCYCCHMFYFCILFIPQNIIVVVLGSQYLLCFTQCLPFPLLHSFCITMFPSRVIFLLPTELPFALLLNKWLLPTHSHHICPPRSWFQSSCRNSWTFFF